MVQPTEIIRVQGAQHEVTPDLIGWEEPLEIRMGYGPEQSRQQISLSVTMRTPGHDYELALGFLFTEGVVASYDQIESIKHCEDAGRQEERNNIVRVELKPDVVVDFAKLQRNFYTTSSCGVCGKSSIDAVRVACRHIPDGVTMAASVIHVLPEKLHQQQPGFEHTGGLHASALFQTDGSWIMAREDVGRHNALDKVIGAMLFQRQVPLHRHVLLVSGRTSFELIQKAAVAGIPIVAGVGAPSSLAVSLAKEVNITLLGFVRNNRFNIYSGAHRILF
jgi:FdhD protein